jgi:hypothetical protein
MRMACRSIGQRKAGWLGALTLVVALAMVGVASNAASGAGAPYPDWSGQWQRIGGVQWDPSNPLGRRQQAPYTAEYQKIFEANLDNLASGGDGNNPTYRCLPAGMPREMTLVEPMQIVITPDTTYLIMEYMRELRRIYTDGRAWQEAIEPTFDGYSIGSWQDQDGDGRYRTLVAETRGMKGPRTLDSSGMPLHADNATVVTERLSLDKTDADVLHDEITIADHAFVRPWTVTKSYRRFRKAIWLEFVCEEGNQQVIIGKENYEVSGDGYLMPTKKSQPPPDLKYFNQPQPKQ